MEQPRKADSIYRFLIGRYPLVDPLLRIPCTQRCSVERGLLYIDVLYTVRGTNDPRNLVFPFYTIPDDGSEY